MKRFPHLFTGFIVASLSLSALAGTAEEDWQAVIALDAGPHEQPDSPKAVGSMVTTHLSRQERALRTFLAAHPQDAHAFEAEIRLSRALQIRGDFEASEKLHMESKRILDSLEKTVTPEQRPELEFAKIARMMRILKRSDSTQRDDLLKATRAFTEAYPTDHRDASLLAEVAGLYDTQPKLKESLLEDAQAMAKDPDLKARIADDLTRVHLLGQEVPLKFTSVQGQEIDVASFAGKPVFIIFFAQNSVPSILALTKLQQAVATLPQGSIRVLGVSLDRNRETVVDTLKSHGLSWPTAWDGKGWEGATVRGFGINALPTVWLLDSHGKLRSLSALEGAASLARQLMRD